jgi:hypothetical protein
MTPEEKAARIAAMEPVFDCEDGEDLFAEPDAPRPEENPHSSFVSALIGSGMVEVVCGNCGRPWLTRPIRKLVPIATVKNAVLSYPWLDQTCPVCVGEPKGWKPADAGRWVTFWRRQLVGVLRERGRPVLELMKPAQWVPDIQLHLVHAIAYRGGEITRWYIENIGMVPNEPRWPPATFARGCEIRAWMPLGLKVAAVMVPTTQPNPKKTESYAVPFLPIDR